MKPSLNLLVGIPNSGKSTLIHYLLYEMLNHNKVDMVYLFSHSRDDPSYSYIPRKWTFPGYSEDILRKIIVLQRSYRIKRGLPPLNIILVYDDCIDRKVIHSKLWSDLINNHRHIGITIIYSLQYMAGNISSNYRSILDSAYIFRHTTDTSLRSIYSDFFSSYLTFQEYSKMNSSLKKYEFIRVSPKQSEDNISVNKVDLASRVNYAIEYSQQA